MEFSIRDATQADGPFLIEMLYQALFVPPGELPLPADIIDRPDLARYARGFGHQNGDDGWIAESTAGDMFGAAWVRQLPAEGPGYGFVDADTPELSIAIVPDRRSSGIGTALLGESPRCSAALQPVSRRSERCGQAL